MQTLPRSEAHASKPKRGIGPQQPLAAAQIPDALLTIKNACALAGMSSATFYRRAADDATFPKLIRKGPRFTRVRAGDLTAWLQGQGK